MFISTPLWGLSVIEYNKRIRLLRFILEKADEVLVLALCLVDPRGWYLETLSVVLFRIR